MDFYELNKKMNEAGLAASQAEHKRKTIKAGEKYEAKKKGKHIGRPKGATVGGNPRYSGKKGWGTTDQPDVFRTKGQELDENTERKPHPMKTRKGMSVPYNPSIDGPPLKPGTISGAEMQIKELATQIRTTFGLDPKWADHKKQILDATKLLDQAADSIGDYMDGSLRNDPHKFHGQFQSEDK